MKNFIQLLATLMCRTLRRTVWALPLPLAWFVPLVMVNQSIQAATYVKKSGTTLYNVATTWTPSGPPGYGDIAEWNVNTGGAASGGLGASMTWLGLSLTDTANNQSIGQTTGATLTLGSSGITFSSSATRPLTLSCQLALGSAQTWNVAGGSLTVSRTVANGGYLLTIGGNNNTTISAVISGTGGLEINRSGSNPVTLSGLNTFQGFSILTAGKVYLNSAETANTSGPLGKWGAGAWGSIILNGGYLQHSTVNQRDYSGRFDHAANQRYNIDSNGQNVTWATALVSSGGTLTKVGVGTLTLSGVNTYDGNTTVSEGTLALSGSGSIANSPTISVGSGAAFDVSPRSTTLTLGNSQTLSGPSTAGTATLNAGASTGLSMGASTTLWLPYLAPGTASFNVTGGALTLASGNPVHVVSKNGGTPLPAGDYQLISTGTGGSVAGTAPSSVILNDAGSDGIAAGLQASLVLNSPGSGLYLHVYNPCTPVGVGPVSPSTQTVCAGGSAAFSVTPSGTGPFHYQWRKVGGGNVGTDSSSYTINPVSSGDAGSYECDVTGQCGSPVTATAGGLTVNMPPTSPNTTASTGNGNTLAFDGAKLLAKATGSGLSITAVQTTSSQGGSVSLNAGPPVAISYTAPGSGSSDSFWYTITDGNGCTVSPTINLTLTASNGESPNVVAPATFASGIFSVTFAGIPNVEYTVQSAESASGPWSYLKKATAGTNGLFEVTDGPYSSPPPSRYYRLDYP